MENREIHIADAFANSHPAGLLYYSGKYSILLGRLLQCTPEYHVATQDGAISGLLPLMRIDGPLGTVLNSLPYFGSHGGALASTTEAASALTAVYERLCLREGICSSTWIANPFDRTQAIPLHSTHQDFRHSQVTPLDTPDGIDALIDSSARRNVRKALEHQVRVSIEIDAIDFLHATHVTNMAAIGGNPKNRAFFELVSSIFEPDKDFRIYVARLHGRPVAALLVFYFGHTVEYFTPVTESEFRECQPMALILREAMENARDMGYKNWNWGGTWVAQQGVFRFKRKWGAISTTYKYYTRVHNAASLAASPAELLANYPGFYIAPFSALTGS